ncbi:unnamed protein product [Adineta ricciae]|uniref:AB hydrolase-1 domain-containing protein n=1 Tax=Adineta ricciae TaxID=249248 RepID=A0A815MC84_ADIRI|nr:unnamed protein product [Adineta ricciae]CAF1419625.1 unnamed protein product [Adineta ricciae]
MSQNNESIATWFCPKQGIQLNSHKTVHLTIHGYTYDHTYWTFPYQSPNYSYVNYVIENSGGDIVILNIDRIGIGLSSKPLATDITVDANANVISQLITNLHNGMSQNVQFVDIVLVGHSLGTLISWKIVSQSAYNRYVRGFIATSWLHLPNPIGTTAVVTLSYPTQLDPKFSQQSLPIGYLTTNRLNHTRQYLFYNINDTDPNVIQVDEETKQTGTAGEIATFGLAYSPTVTLVMPSNISVLVVVGGHVTRYFRARHYSACAK